MADGRMLKKVIVDSPRLAALKNDTHRLIYTWLIPFLDVEGRYKADARIIKGHICTLLDHVTTRTIEAALRDMEENDLITLYVVDGNKYLQLHRFKKHQSLREGREKGSDIPPPNNGTLTEYRRSTDGVPTELSVDTAQQDKIREDKISKDKAAPDKVRHLDCVFLLPEEYEKLKTRYGPLTNHAIEVLNNYKMAKGKTYRSDYHACLSDWVKEKVNGNNKGSPAVQTKPQSTWVICPQCKREVLKNDLEGSGCIKCIIPDIKEIIKGVYDETRAIPIKGG